MSELEAELKKKFTNLNEVSCNFVWAVFILLWLIVLKVIQGYYRFIFKKNSYKIITGF